MRGCYGSTRQSVQFGAYLHRTAATLPCRAPPPTAMSGWSKVFECAVVCDRAQSTGKRATFAILGVALSKGAVAGQSDAGEAGCLLGRVAPPLRRKSA